MALQLFVTFRCPMISHHCPKTTDSRPIANKQGGRWPDSESTDAGRGRGFLAWTCRACTRPPGQPVPSRPGEFHPESLTEPDLILSHHPARAIARRLPPSAESSGSSRILPSWPMLNGDDPPPLLRGHYPASSLLRGSPPLSGASVLSASRLEPLVLFPLASPARFSRSVPEPD
jgi:hypothetical protein